MVRYSICHVGAVAVLLMPGCGDGDRTPCFLAGGNYEITYSLVTSDCAEGVIQPSWTAEREIGANDIRCGDHEETAEKYIGGGCWEECTEKQQVEASSFAGRMTCDMACGGINCRYEADLDAVLKSP